MPRKGYENLKLTVKTEVKKTLVKLSKELKLSMSATIVEVLRGYLESVGPVTEEKGASTRPARPVIPVDQTPQEKGHDQAETLKEKYRVLAEAGYKSPKIRPTAASKRKPPKVQHGGRHYEGLCLACGYGPFLFPSGLPECPKCGSTDIKNTGKSQEMIRETWT